jgi:hypothetical protein
VSKRKTKEEFIAEARSVHGDKYDYSRVVYKNNQTKIRQALIASKNVSLQYKNMYIHI